MLISDPDYLIHTLRLTYLRDLDDPYGPRIITLNPRYTTNPYIRASGLSDSERWSELNMPSSPQPVVDVSMEQQQLSNGRGSRDRYATQPAEPAGVWPGATGLKYTQTIMGKRSGGIGMRVSGVRDRERRSSGTRHTTSSIISDSRFQRIRADSAPTPVSSSPSPVLAVQVTSDSPEFTPESPLATVGKRRSSGGSTIMEKPIDEWDGSGQTNDPVAPPPPPATDAQDPVRPPLPAFALRFARGAEMEARRRDRMRLRNQGAAMRAQAEGRSEGGGADVEQVQQPPPPSESAMLMSSDEEELRAGGVGVGGQDVIDSDVTDDSSDDDALLGDVLMMDDGENDEVGEMQEDDDFDGDEFLKVQFGAKNTPGTAISDDNSVISSSSPQSSTFTSSLQVVGNVRSRTRLSPVTEAYGERRESGDASLSDTSSGNIAEIHLPVAPIPRRLNQSHFSLSPPSHPSTLVSPNQLHPSETSPAAPAPTATDSNQLAKPIDPNVPLTANRKPRPSFGSRTSEIAFTRQKVQPANSKPPVKSALTAKLAAQSTVSDNPFTELYAAISGRADTASVSIRVFFPHSPIASAKPLLLKVRKDATVEEVIGFGLWMYHEQGLEPRLDAGLGPDDPRRNIKLSAVGWNLRIAEDDGEIDEDYPAPDRTQPVSKFAFDFGICEANPNQVEQNRSQEAKIVRRPSRLMIAKKSRPDPSVSTTAASTLAPPSTTNAVSSSSLTSSDVLASSAFLGVSSQTGTIATQGPPVFLRVRVATAADMHYSTTINATSEEYMADVLDRVCRRRRLPDPKEWALVTGDMRIVIPMDRTVASLAGKSELVLVKRALLDQLGLGKDKRLGRSSDPNASIFKRFSEVPAVNNAMDFTAAYKKFTVLRKMPMLVGRHERTLAIDGDYIHIMPAGTRGLLDSVKTSSYHIKSVVFCKQNKKPPTSSVKLIVWRDGGNKRYDFEAEDSKKAAEIVSTIKNLQKSYSLERSGTVKQPGKSRRVRHLRP